LQLTEPIPPALYSLLRSTRSASVGPGYGFGVLLDLGAVGRVAVGRVVVGRLVTTALVGAADGVSDGSYVGE
jgi:hypothetical protein